MSSAIAEHELPGRPFANSYWVEPGRLLAGEYPGGRTPEETRERIGRLLAAGVDFFLDLTGPDELEAYDLALPDAVAYVHKPIPDHDVPRERGHMSEILEFLAGALADGRCVYVHCRAGIGRTGMTVGCHLVERGLDPEAALARLNELWRQSARSQAWPSVPETPEQVEFVRAWSAGAGVGTATAAPQQVVRDEAPAAAGARLRERFRGALLGLACGDALAAATQRRRPGSFPPVEDIAGGGPFELPRGAWSDDTAMALCLAESLVEQGGFDARDQVQRYLLWQQQGRLSATGRCLGITPGVARALAAAQWRRQLYSGSHDPKQLDPEPLARVAPVVMYFHGSAAEAVRLAGESARTTCQAPAVIEACRLFGAMLHAALAGADKAAILAPEAALWEALPPRPRLAELARGSYRGKEASRIRSGHDILRALEAVLWAFDRTGSFREGALLAANLGGDSDVVTSAYGALAGACYGAESIPPEWLDCLAAREQLEGLAGRLLTRL